MSDLVEFEVVDAAAAAELAEQFGADYPQHPSFAREAAAAVKADVEFGAFRRDGIVVGYCAVRVKRIPVLGGGLAYIHRGPAVTEGSEGCALWTACVRALITRYGKAQGLSLRIAPPVERDGEIDRQREAALAACGLAPVSSEPERTIVVDIAPALGDIRRVLGPKWRGHLSKGERSGVTVTRSRESDAFAQFGAMLDDLEKSKGFSSGRDTGFFARVAAGAGSHEQVWVHLASVDGQIVAGHVGCFCGGRAVYLLGATTQAARDVRAAYVLQWAVIEFAKSLGIETYDLGGIDEVGNPNVFSFKNGMGGTIRDVAPAMELAARGISAWLVRSAMRWKRRLRR